MTKGQYLESIRSNSAYPVYRGVIGTIAILGYLLAAVYGLAALIMGFGAMRGSFFLGLGYLVGGLIVAALTFLLARFFKEAALILADIGDSLVDSNAQEADRQRAPATT